LIKNISIGSNSANDIFVNEKNVKEFHAIILYKRGNYFITPISDSDVSVNGQIIKNNYKLSKSDIFKIGKKTIHWCDYYPEGDSQEIQMSTLFDYHGRINRSNYRALFLVFIGLAICIFFIPGLIVGLISGRRRTIDFDSIEAIQNILTPFYFLGYGALLVLMILISIKRIRDTGEKIWKLLIPIYNLKLLLIDESKIW